MILLMLGLLFSQWHLAAATDHAEDRTSHTERQTINTEAQLISASDDITDTEDHTSDTEAHIIDHQGLTDLFQDNLAACAFQSDSDRDCIDEVTRGVGAISNMMDNVSNITIDSFDITLIPVRLHTCSAFSRPVSPAACYKKNQLCLRFCRF